MVELSQMVQMARRTFPHTVLVQQLGTVWDFVVVSGVDAQGNGIEAQASIVEIPDPNDPESTIKALSVVPLA